jgi:hypothetical protein
MAHTRGLKSEPAPLREPSRSDLNGEDAPEFPPDPSTAVTHLGTGQCHNPPIRARTKLGPRVAVAQLPRSKTRRPLARPT